MECTPGYGPHPPCSPDSRSGFGEHLGRRGVARGLPRLLYTMGQRTFSARQGPAYFGVHAEEPHDTIALRALAAGHARRGTGRLVGVDQATVWDWRDRAGRPWRAVTTSRFDHWPIPACPVDAWWSFVRQQDAPLTVAEKVLALYGEAWVWSAFAPPWRLVAAFVVGKRAHENAHVRLERRQAVSGG